MILLNKKTELQVGQIVYVESTGWANMGNRDVVPYKITKINTTSIYAIRCKDFENEIRFDKKTWISKGYMYTDRIWLSEESYKKYIGRREEKMGLQVKIKKTLMNLSLEQLKAVDDFLKE